MFPFMLGIIVGVLATLTVIATAILIENYLDEKQREQRTRHEAVTAYSKQFAVSYEEADRLVHTEP